MRTASERRAAGEAAFCDCEACIGNARILCRDFARERGLDLLGGARPIEAFAALLRALVVQTLLDPVTWARPAGWRP